MKKVLGFKIPDFKLDFQLFQGTISNCKKQVLSDVKGSGYVGTGLWGNIVGSSKVSTTHKHYTTFDIDGATFRCDGEYPFSDGDKVVLYASLTDEGYYQVEILKNFTRKFFIKCTAMNLRELWSSLAVSGGVPAVVFSGASALVVGGWFYMSVLRKARKKAATLNKEIEAYPEF